MQLENMESGNGNGNRIQKNGHQRPIKVATDYSVLEQYSHHVQVSLLSVAWKVEDKLTTTLVADIPLTSTMRAHSGVLKPRGTNLWHFLVLSFGDESL